MSGHSKWATIHRQKELKDAKRGAVFTKMGAAIVVAVREGGGIGDPEKNFRLRLAVDRARQFNMPKENITRAIEKATGGGGEGELSDVMYEGFLPGGCAVMIQAVTDNKARTAQQVRSALEKHGGSMGGSGAVSYMFSPKGEIRVSLKKGKTAQAQELEIIDASGVEDMEADKEGITVWCDKENTFGLKEELEKLGFEVETADLVMKPETAMPVSDQQTQEKVEQTVEAVEELDDVAHVFTNYQPE